MSTQFRNTVADLKACRESLVDLFEAETVDEASEAFLADAEQDAAGELAVVAWDMLKIILCNGNVDVDAVENSMFPEAMLREAVETSFERAYDRAANLKDDCCPSCGWEAGDGVNPRCDDEDGCGFWRDAEMEDDDEE